MNSDHLDDQIDGSNGRFNLDRQPNWDQFLGEISASVNDSGDDIDKRWREILNYYTRHGLTYDDAQRFYARNPSNAPKHIQKLLGLNENKENEANVEF